jgi:ABC-type Fe3+/spermidine/putrescine transport system ATPase subunit
VSVEALRIEGLHKSFGRLEVLKGIDMVVAQHEVVCLIGASGSGKSTLLRCINLLEPIDAGRVTVAGQEITRRGTDADRIRRGIGIVFQAFNLFPHMSVLRNVTKRRSCWSASGSRTSATSSRIGCPVVSSSAWPSSVRWPCNPIFCCSMRSPVRWTLSWWLRYSTSSGSWRGQA